MNTESSPSEEKEMLASSFSPAVGSISSADIETLHRIMTQLNTPTASTSFAQTGIFANFHVLYMLILVNHGLLTSELLII